MIVIGITGGVGCGKSRVLDYIGKHVNCRILLADEVAHLLKEPGTKCHRQLVELLGSTILEEDGTIHREKMAEMIFCDEALLSRVNEIIHPAVKDYILREIDKGHRFKETDAFFLEAALLIESGYVPYLDELWYIYSEKEVRKKRLQEGRGYTARKTEMIMEKQLDDEEFRRHAQVIIDNSRTFTDTCRQLEREGRRLGIWQEVRAV